MTPRLSILIPSIPSRWEKAKALYDHLQTICEGKDVEIILMMDNKKRTIGEKREALKNVSNGKYFMFVDDDDSLYEIEDIYEATANDVDVITFKSKSLNSDGSSFIVEMKLRNPVEHTSENGRYLDIKRPPFTQCAWSERFKSIKFPASNYGEDWAWVEQCLPISFLETHIPKVLHGYNFDPKVSEAVVEGTRGIDIVYDVKEIEAELMLSTNKRRVIVNLATEKYWSGQRRLEKSIEKTWYIINIHRDETEVNAPPHKQNPYAFKIYAIEQAKQHYDQVLWLDASVYAVKNPKPVFDWIDKYGYFMEEAGHYVGQWCNDETLAFFEITREEAMKMPMFSAGFVGLDFRNETAVTFFSRWKNAMLNGMFKGSWNNHRHDMTCGSIIANQMGLKYSPGGQFFSYVGPGYGEPSETSVFHLSGMP